MTTDSKGNVGLMTTWSSVAGTPSLSANVAITTTDAPTIGIKPEKLSHRYLFDANDRLMRIEDIHQGRVTYVEDLSYTSNSRIGITSLDGKIYNVCEEIFENGHIVSAAIMSYYELDRERLLCDLHWEEYAYDEKGLCFCDFVPYFDPNSIHFAFSQYTFVVQDGLLTSYTDNADHQHKITKKRDAQGKGFFFP